MNILIVDNTIDRDSWGAEGLRRLACAIPGATITVRRAPEQDLPASPRPFDRIILSGSKTSALADAPWIEKLHQFVRSTLNESIPFLGVCYGHQVLAQVVGGAPTCRKAKTPELGWTLIEVLAEHPLFSGLPDQFYSFSSHFDEVAEVSSELQILARSRDCEIQALRLRGKPAYGIQFHPEKNERDAEAVFAIRKKAKAPKALLHPGRSKELYDPRVGERIFRNFLESAEGNPS